MNKEIFYQQVEAEVKKSYPDSIVKCEHFTNSRCSYQGLVVTEANKKHQAKPVVNLDAFYEELDLCSFEEVMERIFCIIEQEAPDSNKIMDILENYDKASDHLYIDVLPKQYPDSIGFGVDGFFLTVRVSLDIKDDCVGSCVVTNKLLEIWDKPEEIVIAQALKNTIK